MPAIIPLVARLNDWETAQWLRHFETAFPNARVAPLETLTPQERAQARCAIVANPDTADLATLPNLKWVQSLWAGVERLVRELPDDTIAITRMNDPQLAETMAEAVLAWTLYLHRDMPLYRQQQNTAQWVQHDVTLPKDRPIGILGLGTLGRAAATKLRSSNFPVLGWSRTPTTMPEVETFSGKDGLDTLLSRSRILVLLLPLTPETTGLLNAERLARLPQGAALINFARGPIIETEALLHTLETRHLNHAVLDVFKNEPLPPTCPYWSHPHITVLPHISGPTSYETASKVAAHNIRTYLETGNLPPIVNRSQGY